MEEKMYSVSEAVRLIGVESHVLRYWEEELGISIQRTKLGHRAYSEQDIATFCRVREWKQKGLQLKAIRLLLEEQDAEGQEFLHSIAYGEQDAAAEAANLQEGAKQCVPEMQPDGVESAAAAGGIGDELQGIDESGDEPQPFREAEREPQFSGEAGSLVYEIISTSETQSDLERGVALLRQMIEEVVAEQNKRLEQELAEQIREDMEALYLQYLQAMREAAASRSREEKRGLTGRLLQKIAEFFRD